MPREKCSNLGQTLLASAVHNAVMSPERRKITKSKLVAAESLLRNVVNLQGEFWDAVLELEQLLNVSIDCTRDLSEWDVESLYLGLEDDSGPASRIGPAQF